mgnify:CR=1 FL=1
MKDYLNAFKNIFNYKDEATLKEFWNFFIFNWFFNIIIRLLAKRFSQSEYLYDTINVNNFKYFINVINKKAVNEVIK